MCEDAAAVAGGCSVGGRFVREAVEDDDEEEAERDAAVGRPRRLDVRTAFLSAPGGGAGGAGLALHGGGESAGLVVLRYLRKRRRA